jgi:hypothetical protein
LPVTIRTIVRPSAQLSTQEEMLKYEAKVIWLKALSAILWL